MYTRKIGRIRHFRQKFNSKDDFIWSKKVNYNGAETSIGSNVPKCLINNEKRLFTFWNAHYIQVKHVEHSTPGKIVSTVYGEKVPKNLIIKRFRGANGTFFKATDRASRCVKDIHDKKELITIINNAKQSK
ncbi:MAG: hypothetical protein V3T09_08530 [bacterium]